MRRLTQEEFIGKSREVHGGKYDYSKAKYVNAQTKVCVICPTHGEFWQHAFLHMQGAGCPKCASIKSGQTQSRGRERFVCEARKIHGSKYDYSKTEYTNSYTPLIIICPEHGEFLQTARCHLSGCGCSKCGERKKALNRRKNRQSAGVVLTNNFVCDKPSYRVWKDMMRRCYNRGKNKRWLAYEGCTVCDEWFIFDVFDEWFTPRYKEGWHLDKDILLEGNRVYSPETCCVVPREINEFFRRINKPSGLPRGVKRAGNQYSVEIQFRKRKHYLGTFETADEAGLVFQNKKKELIALIAEEYKSQLEDRVYKALTQRQYEK